MATGISQDTTTTMDFETALQDIIEGGILPNMNAIKAAHAVGLDVKCPTVQELDGASNEKPFIQLLTAYAYDVEGRDRLDMLGIALNDGPAYSKEDLEKRGGWASKLINKFGINNALIKDKTEILKTNFVDAVNNGKEKLEELLMARRQLKGAAKNLPRWREVAGDLPEYLCSGGRGELPGGIRIALQLRNSMKQNHSQLPNLVDMTETRAPAAKEFGATETMESTPKLLIRMKPILVRAPAGQEQTIKIAGVIKKLIDTTELRYSITSAMPIGPLPGCKTAEHMTDVWTHALLCNKSKDAVCDIRVLCPPTNMIFAGKFAPIHFQKHLAIIRMGQKGKQHEPEDEVERRIFSYV